MSNFREKAVTHDTRLCVPEMPANEELELFEYDGTKWFKSHLFSSEISFKHFYFESWTKNTEAKRSDMN